AVDRTFEMEAFRAFQRAIEGHPGHDLRIGEVLSPRAHLPDALIGLAPDRLQMREQLDLQVPPGTGGAEAADARVMQRVGDFPVDVELQLRVRGIADTDRLCALVARQPRNNPFQAAPLAR